MSRSVSLLVYNSHQMRTQARQLKQLLEHHGWEITRRVAPTDQWWIDELWELSSTWSPRETRAFVSFVVDPQASGSRRMGEQVWAVAIGSAPAAGPTPSGAVPLGRGWEARRDQLVDIIQSLRG